MEKTYEQLVAENKALTAKLEFSKGEALANKRVADHAISMLSKEQIVKLQKEILLDMVSVLLGRPVEKKDGDKSN